MYRPFGVLRLVAAFLEVDLSTGLGEVFDKSNTGKAATSRSTPKVSVRSAHIDLIPGGSSYRITESPPHCGLDQVWRMPLTLAALNNGSICDRKCILKHVWRNFMKGKEKQAQKLQISFIDSGKSSQTG